MKVRYIFLSSVLLLSGCGSTAQYNIPKLDQGVGGYEGDVSPITVPYKLRYEPGPETLNRVTQIRRLGSERSRVSGVGRSKIEADGNSRIFQFILEELDINGKALRSNTPPLLVLRGQGPSRGPFDDIDLSFPYFRQEGIEVPARGSEEYRQWIDLFSSLTFALPEGPIEMNTELLPPNYFLDVLTKADRLTAEDKEMIRSTLRRDTLSSRIIGETYDSGTHCLVAILDGSMAGQIRSASFDLNISGYWLINSKTGYSHRYAVLMNFNLDAGQRSSKLEFFAEFHPEVASDR